MHLVSEIVEIQIPFDHGKVCFSPLLTDVNCLKFIDLKVLPHLLPVTLPRTEQMTHTLKLNKTLCKDFLPLELLKVGIE